MSIRQLDEILAQRKHVMEFDRTAEPPSKEVVDSLLRRAWKVTPSKNNFMPYTINVLGPEYQAEKDHLYRKSLASETSANKNNPIPDSHDQLNMPAYACIASCDYLLVFTDRWEDQPNPYQKMCWDKLGVFHAPMTQEGVRSIGETVSLEVGMFATSFAGLCVDNGIDVSYTLNFKRRLEEWDDTWFVNERPMLIMSIGTARVYREDLKQHGLYKGDLRPEYERIVKWL